EIEQERRETILDSAYSHTVFNGVEIVAVAADVEGKAIKAALIDERIKKIKKSIEKSKGLFQQAIKKLDTRNRILLFVYFRTGITLTNNRELHNAKEIMIDILDDLKNIESTRIQKEYARKLSIQLETKKWGKRKCRMNI